MKCWNIIKQLTIRLINVSNDHLWLFSCSSPMLGCITAWYGIGTAHNCRALQRVVRTAQHITGYILPALQDTYSTWCHRKAKKIIKDINHPSHGLYTPLTSRKPGQYRCIKAGTERLKNSFYLKAIRLESAWASIPVERFRHLVEPKPQRIGAVLRAKGGATKY